MKELNFIAIFSTMERTVLSNQTAYSFMKIQLNVDMDNFVSKIIVCSSIKQMRRMWMTTKLRILKTLMKVNQTSFVTIVNFLPMMTWVWKCTMREYTRVTMSVLFVLIGLKMKKISIFIFLLMKHLTVKIVNLK